MTQERTTLLLEEAIAMLPAGKTIHTFVNVDGILLGADCDRNKIISDLKNFAPELSGETATSMGHGLVYNDGSKYVFVETKEVVE